VREGSANPGVPECLSEYPSEEEIESGEELVNSFSRR